MNKREVCVVPTYKRPEHLYCCLKRIRTLEPSMPICVFPDRGSWKDEELLRVVSWFDLVNVDFVPDHDYIGNTFNTMEAFRSIFNEGWETIYYIEDDVMVHKNFFDWHREQFEEVPELFASMAWVFNRHAPLVDDVLYQPWYYSVGTCFKHEMLEHIVKHASPRYYADMPGYIASAFPESTLNVPFAIQHFEQDGLIQRVLNQRKGTTASPGISKCDHIGFFGYNQGWQNNVEIFKDYATFEERVERLEEFIGDPEWRANIFGHDIVEREVGRPILPRKYIYRIKLPNGFESTFETSLAARQLPGRINSVTLVKDTIITQLS